MIVTFAEIKPGQLFRALRADIIKSRLQDEPKHVLSDGLYVKVGTTFAIDIAHGNKDAILSTRLPCRVLPKTVDISHTEAYEVYHRNAPRHK